MQEFTMYTEFLKTTANKNKLSTSLLASIKYQYAKRIDIPIWRLLSTETKHMKLIHIIKLFL